MKIIFGTFVILIGLFLVWFGSTYERAEQTNREIILLASNNKIDEALQAIDSLRNELIFWPLKTYALADPFEMKKKFLYGEALLKVVLGKTEEAENSWRSLYNASDEELRLRSLYNFGNVLVYKGEWRAAEKAYIDALKCRSTDEDSKVNLELLKKKEKEETARREAKKSRKTGERRNDLEFFDDFTRRNEREASKKIRW